jgi:putative methyltransferase (TIGR04325 family)
VLPQGVKDVVRDLLPPVLLRGVRHLRPAPIQYGHRGDYPSFAEALAACGTAGGAEPNVVETVAGWTRAIRDRAAGGRSVPLNDRSLQNLAALLVGFGPEPRDEVRILDFGGALGGLYYELREFIPRRRKLSWTVCEIPLMAATGTQSFATDELSFVGDLAALHGQTFDAVIASGSLQCVPTPLANLEALAPLSNVLILNRMPLIDASKDRLTVHHVNPEIYAASVPNWFFSETVWLAKCRALGFDLAMRWRVPQDTHRLDGNPVEFAGLLCCRNQASARS